MDSNNSAENVLVIDGELLQDGVCPVFLSCLERIYLFLMQTHVRFH